MAQDKDMRQELAEKLGDVKADLNSLKKVKNGVPAILLDSVSELVDTLLSIGGFAVDQAEYVDSVFEEIDARLEQVEGGDETRIMPEDAEKLIAYIESCNGMFQTLLANLPPGTPGAAEMTKLVETGKALISDVKDATAQPDDEDDEAEEEDEDDS